jgi:hypothetical protein
VASEVALDYPVLNHFLSYGSDFPDAEAAPKGSTALGLCCAHLALEIWLTKRGHHPKKQDEQTSMMVECAILLVKLGADFHRKFTLDPPFPKFADPCSLRIIVQGLVARRLSSWRRWHSCRNWSRVWKNYNPKRRGSPWCIAGVDHDCPVEREPCMRHCRRVSFLF